jgi:hypothetical protein
MDRCICSEGICLVKARRKPRRTAAESTELLSQEAVAFWVMHHLSNMVRYRPEEVVKLAGSRWFFLFTTWVPRAMENFLLAMSSRLLAEEVRIG